ncbi:hypothetical protein OH828_37030 [Streptomyces anulatus]|nr:MULTISPECIES: hypothetical protein [Streptomyces]WIY74259.1 hypothetical protein QPM16_00155 [Streptomyces anulatus]
MVRTVGNKRLTAEGRADQAKEKSRPPAPTDAAQPLYLAPLEF